MLAPIAFFAYNRPEHTRKSLESLSQNEGAESSDLFIFCDGAKNLEDEEAVRQVKEVARSKQWCGNVHVIEQKQNKGCANSIIQGVTKTCSEYGSVIVLEDDLIISPSFLHYMNSALDLYQNEESIMQISGYMFPIEFKSLKTDTCLLPFTASWGWATWERAWKHFDPDMKGYEKLKSNEKQKYKFDLNGSYPYFHMLEDQLNGKVDAWCIRWYLSAYMLDGLTLYPKSSLVSNIGFDGSGTHCGISASFNTDLPENTILSMPSEIKVNHEVVNLVCKYLRSLSQATSLLQRIKNKLLQLRN